MNDNDTQNTASREKKTVIQVYAVLGVSMVLSVLPNMTAAMVCTFFILGVLIAAYLIRSRAEDGSLAENHMTYIIRTIWIAGFISVFTMIAGSAYMLTHIDNSPLDACIDQIMNAGHNHPAAPYSAEPYGMFMPCLSEFFETNKTVLIISAAIAAGPVLLYFIYRYFNGLARAIKGYRLAHPTSWF